MPTAALLTVCCDGCAKPCKTIHDARCTDTIRGFTDISGSVGQGQRFQLTQPLSSDELYALTDLDLGSRQLERFKWQQDDSWVRATLVANFVEYEALEVNKWGVFKCTSRIKAEEEIWNKVNSSSKLFNHAASPEPSLSFTHRDCSAQ